MKSYLLLILSGLVFYCQHSQAQCPPPSGPATTYGTTAWIGYVFSDQNLTSYAGTITRGTGTYENFSEDFGGSYSTFGTSNCNVYAETFSVRFKLRKTFANDTYTITVGGDDGIRFSLDGGATWVIDAWVPQVYTEYTYEVVLNGSYDMVLEYYEASGDNEVSFNMDEGCVSGNNQTNWGSNSRWRGYLYQGTNFNFFKGRRDRGTTGGPANFTDDFTSPNTLLGTTDCDVQTEAFSARYKLRQNFPRGNYVFNVGGDDGYRFSIDGGATWVINQWGNTTYNTSSYSLDVFTARSIDLVIEFFSGTGSNQISFLMTSSTLPITLLDFGGKMAGDLPILTWKVSPESSPDRFVVERGADGQHFVPIGTVPGTHSQTYSFTDQSPFPGIGYYRLEMIDKDGSNKYSTIVTINTRLKNEIKVYPTLVNQSRLLFVRLDRNVDDLRVAITNISGQKILEKKFGKTYSGQTVTVPLREGTLPKGTYVVQVLTALEAISKQMIVVQ